MAYIANWHKNVTLIHLYVSVTQAVYFVIFLSFLTFSFFSAIVAVRLNQTDWPLLSTRNITPYVPMTLTIVYC